MILFEDKSDWLRKSVAIPQDVYRALNTAVLMYDGPKTGPGYKHAMSIIDANYNKRGAGGRYLNPRITVNNLKRIKNFFDNFTGDPKSDPTYLLYGGDTMRRFVDDTLKTMRDEKALTSKTDAQRARDLTHYTKPQKPVKVNGQDVDMRLVAEERDPVTYEITFNL